MFFLNKKLKLLKMPATGKFSTISIAPITFIIPLLI